MSCSVCCNDIQDFAVGPCNHRDLCAKCMLHYVMLFKESKCPSCKEEISSIAITTDSVKSYSDIVNGKTTVFDQHLDIYFESKQLANLYHNRLGLRCPLCYMDFEKDNKKPNPEFKKDKELINHVLTVHKRILCEICLKHLKVFPYEMLCYTREQYDKHLRNGVNDLNLDYRIDPHPACRFCKERLFNEKLLIKHMETAHQHCIFCPSEANAYFSSSSALMRHYKSHHFVCDYPGCVEESFSVFSDRIELMQHKQQVHHERVVVDLSELAGDFIQDEDEEQISDADIKLAKTFLVEDPSGWSAEEVRRRNRLLQAELLKAFDGNKEKLERYQHMCGEFIQGTISPAIFHDMSINLLGTKNLGVLSHLISLISEPEKRHVLETIFRAAKGKKSSVLGKEFLASIGANETKKKTGKITPAMAANATGYVPHRESARDAAWEMAEQAEVTLERTKSTGLITLSKEEQEEEEVKGIEYPSSYAVSRGIQLQWRKLKKELNHLCELKSGLVEKKKVVLSELLYSLSLVVMELIHILDETLSDRARKTSWEGIGIDLMDQLRDIVNNQGDRELYKIEWLPMLRVSEKSVTEFQNFYDLFIDKEKFIIPPQTTINKNKHILNSIPPRDLNILREVFVMIVEKAISRLSELTKDVEEEQRKRYEALKIPAKPVKEVDYSTLLNKESKPTGAWGKPVMSSTATSSMKEDLFPALPHAKPLTINGKFPVINKKQAVVRRVQSVSLSHSPSKDLPQGGFSPVARSFSEGEYSPVGSTSPIEEKPIASRFYTPPLPSNKKPSSNPVNAGWGVRKPDQFEIAVENALKQKEQQKKKGKGNRGVKLTF